MEKVKKILVVASKKGFAAELLEFAHTVGETVLLAVAGERDGAVNADKAYYFGGLDDVSFISYIPGIVSLTEAEKPEVVLAELTKNGRLAAAHIAAALHTSVLTDAMELWTDGGAVYAKRMVYGGRAIKTECAAGTAVVCMSPAHCAGVSGTPAAEIVDMPAPAYEGISLTGKSCKAVQTVNLNAAAKVVGVGRGFSSEAGLDAARALAAVLGAEIACTRPIAEEEKWLPAERYVGVSGAMIKPAVYVAAGISGQVQHMVGVSDAGLIIAVNKDEHAPIFDACDYGIIGDVAAVLPMLTEKLKA